VRIGAWSSVPQRSVLCADRKFTAPAGQRRMLHWPHRSETKGLTSWRQGAMTGRNSRSGFQTRFSRASISLPSRLSRVRVPSPAPARATASSGQRRRHLWDAGLLRGRERPGSLPCGLRLGDDPLPRCRHVKRTVQHRAARLPRRQTDVRQDRSNDVSYAAALWPGPSVSTRGSRLRLCSRTRACTTLGLNCLPEHATISRIAWATERPAL